MEVRRWRYRGPRNGNREGQEIERDGERGVGIKRDGVGETEMEEVEEQIVWDTEMGLQQQTEFYRNL